MFSYKEIEVIRKLKLGLSLAKILQSESNQPIWDNLKNIFQAKRSQEKSQIDLQIPFNFNPPQLNMAVT